MRGARSHRDGCRQSTGGEQSRTRGRLTLVALLLCVWLPEALPAQTRSIGEFFTVTPCRLFDSRTGAALVSGEGRQIDVSGVCGIVVPPAALSLNVTVVSPPASGHLSLYGDAGAPSTSTLNYAAGRTRANGAVVTLAADGSGTFQVLPVMAGGGAVHVVIDVNGYFTGRCGDLRISDVEECDGSVPPDVTCETHWEPGMYCPAWSPGQPADNSCIVCRNSPPWSPESDFACRLEAHSCVPYCGDGIKTSLEECDWAAQQSGCASDHYCEISGLDPCTCKKIIF
jgi:hypothetical protein